MSREAKLDALIREAFATETSLLSMEVEDVLRRCESPIEKLAAGAFFAAGYRSLIDPRGASELLGELVGKGLELKKSALDDLYSDSWVLSHRGRSFGPYILIQRRVRTDRAIFRPDFIFAERGVAIVVELDGHAFHERTKEQASRDKARDRSLVARGWSVLRFTGSEIYADPKCCILETSKLLAARRAG